MNFNYLIKKLKHKYKILSSEEFKSSTLKKINFY